VFSLLGLVPPSSNVIFYLSVQHLTCYTNVNYKIKGEF
jgi:hypothetical protein